MGEIFCTKFVVNSGLTAWRHKYRPLCWNSSRAPRSAGMPANKSCGGPKRSDKACNHGVTKFPAIAMLDQGNCYWGYRFSCMSCNFRPRGVSHVCAIVVSCRIIMLCNLHVMLRASSIMHVMRVLLAFVWYFHAHVHVNVFFVSCICVSCSINCLSFCVIFVPCSSHVRA